MPKLYSATIPIFFLYQSNGTRCREAYLSLTSDGMARRFEGIAMAIAFTLHGCDNNNESFVPLELGEFGTWCAPINFAYA